MHDPKNIHLSRKGAVIVATIKFGSDKYGWQRTDRSDGWYTEEQARIGSMVIRDELQAAFDAAHPDEGTTESAQAQSTPGKLGGKNVADKKTVPPCGETIVDSKPVLLNGETIVDNKPAHLNCETVAENKSARPGEATSADNNPLPATAENSQLKQKGKAGEPGIRAQEKAVFQALSARSTRKLADQELAKYGKRQRIDIRNFRSALKWIWKRTEKIRDLDPKVQKPKELEKVREILLDSSLGRRTVELYAKKFRFVLSLLIPFGLDPACVAVFENMPQKQDADDDRGESFSRLNLKMILLAIPGATLLLQIY
jgi:hypothetical protein